MRFSNGNYGNYGRGDLSENGQPGIPWEPGLYLVSCPVTGMWANEMRVSGQICKRDKPATRKRRVKDT